jgi:hypothetical protein
MKRAEPEIASLRGKVRIGWWALVALFLCIGIPWAHELAAANRTLRGMVMNDGEPIRGAVVQLETCATLEIRTFITQNDGQYHFSGLTYGVDYQVWAKRGDRESRKKTLSQFNEQPSVTIDLILEYTRPSANTESTCAAL